MYAAAGGASLASRQARQRQRQQKKTQQLQAKLHPPKASGLSAAEHGASTPTRQSRQFHQLPTNYLRTPQMHARKLSASYTAQSKLLLPIDEGGDTQSVLQMRMHSHGAAHAAHAHHSHSHVHAHPQQQYIQHQQAQPQHHYHHHGRVSPKLVHRHSGSSGSSFHHTHLPKSATATLPLVSQLEATPPTSPLGLGVGVAAAKSTDAAAVQLAAAATAISPTAAVADSISVPAHHDAIIVTPATPMASPGHLVKAHVESITADELQLDITDEKQPLTSAIGDDGVVDADAVADAFDDDEPMQPPVGPMERKCSVYRMRRSDAFDHQADAGGGSVRRQLKELQFHQQQQYEPLLTDEPQLLFKGLPNGRYTICAYCEEGICVCEHIECAQGRAAWLERGRRCSVQDSQQQAVCHRRWVKRNRIQDASLGGSSDDEDFLGVLRGPSTFANAFLYVGLGTIALGLVIAFVGTGEKGFKTTELRLIGPSLIVLGLICCILRILFCICPSHCISSTKKSRKKNGNKVDADHTTSLLRGESKRVSIARGPPVQPKYPITHKRSQSKMLNEGMEALRQIASTSLFMQNEQKSSTNRVVPIINEPGTIVEVPLEMKKLETALNKCEISDDEQKEEKKATTKTEVTETATTTTPTTTSAIATTSIATTMSDASHIQTATTVTRAGSSRTLAISSQEHAPTTSSASKHARTRVALNQQQLSMQQDQEQHQLEQSQSQSLSSSSTVKDSIDEDLLMETSLVVMKPASVTYEARPPLESTKGHSSSAMPRIVPPPTTAPTITSAVTATTLPPPPIYTGIHSRIPLDLPSATPHSYAAASAAAYRASGSERTETLIRGPLGTLTASSSAYAFPTTPATHGLPSVSTTNAISLLPLSMSVTSTIAAMSASNQQAQSIPGQVFDIRPSTSYSAMTAVASSVCQSSAQPGPMATGSVAVTTQQHQLQQFNTSAHAMAAISTTFKFPPQLSSSSQSGSSSASSNGRTSAALGEKLVPPAGAQSAAKFEPELLLSPAKLGQ